VRKPGQKFKKTNGQLQLWNFDPTLLFLFGYYIMLHYTKLLLTCFKTVMCNAAALSSRWATNFYNWKRNWLFI